MTTAAVRIPDEKFEYSPVNRWPTTRMTLSRSSLLRWVWVGTLYSGDRRGMSYAYQDDSFGNLVEIKYICASFADSKDPI